MWARSKGYDGYWIDDPEGRDCPAVRGRKQQTHFFLNKI